MAIKMIAMVKEIRMAITMIVMVIENHMAMTMIAMVRKVMDMVAKAMVKETIMVAIMIMIIITHMVQVVMDKREKVMEVKDQDMDMVKENHMEAHTDIKQINTIMMIVMVKKDMVQITMEMGIPHQDMVMEITMVNHMVKAMEDDHIIKCFK
jgi:hypothetical protein